MLRQHRPGSSADPLPPGGEVLAHTGHADAGWRHVLTPHAHVAHPSGIDDQACDAVRQRRQDLAVDLGSSYPGARLEPPVEAAQKQGALRRPDRWTGIRPDHRLTRRRVLAPHVQAVVHVVVQESDHDDLGSIGLGERSLVDRDPMWSGAQGAPAGFFRSQRGGGRRRHRRRCGRHRRRRGGRGSAPGTRPDDPLPPPPATRPALVWDIAFGLPEAQAATSNASEPHKAGTRRHRRTPGSPTTFTVAANHTDGRWGWRPRQCRQTVLRRFR